MSNSGLVFGKVVSAQLVEIAGEPDRRQWVDKRVELYVTTTESPNGRVDCIRIRKPSRPPKADLDDRLPF